MTVCVLAQVASTFIAYPVSITLYRSIDNFYPEPCDKYCFAVIFSLANILQIINSSISFLFYYFFSSRFRQLLILRTQSSMCRLCKLMCPAAKTSVDEETTTVQRVTQSSELDAIPTSEPSLLSPNKATLLQPEEVDLTVELQESSIDQPQEFHATRRNQLGPESKPKRSVNFVGPKAQRSQELETGEQYMHAHDSSSLPTALPEPPYPLELETPFVTPALPEPPYPLELETPFVTPALPEPPYPLELKTPFVTPALPEPPYPLELETPFVTPGPP
ncbi:hypothetical protein V1264_022593 [Littorina saxatilis]|uniref:Uncharacterized protein n=1 Tax=Littorina saxatilis TaxID=31220 RepID=A0AAN9AKV6_9CAEN